jgi:hypothetical protein
MLEFAGLAILLIVIAALADRFMVANAAHAPDSANPTNIANSFSGDNFVLNPRHMAFVRGDATVLHVNQIPQAGMTCFLIVLGVIMLFSVLTLISYRQGFFAFLFCMVFLYAITFYHRRFRQNRHLEHYDCLIDGSIIAASGSFVSTGFWWVWSRSYRVGWRINVEYSFVSPYGVTCTGKTSVWRDDLRGYIPPTGTKVKVLYARANLFDIL